jgi:hypothetical protein
MPTYMYPMDPTGVAASNKIQNEQHVLTTINSRDYYTLVPKLGPFFEMGFIAEFTDQQGNVRTLVKNVDYYFSNVFLGASRACAAKIWGSITMLDDTLSGVINLRQYQTLGGEWVLAVEAWTELMANLAGNPRTVTWEQLVGTPNQFPVIDHEWDLVDMVGLSALVAEVRGIATAIAQQAMAASNSGHLTDFGDPHRTTKAQVDLGSVENYAVATINELRAGAANKYVTPNTLIQLHSELRQEILTLVAQSAAPN